MSSIVSRSPPFVGSVSSSKERRWISIRWGTSRGFCSREKLLRVTGAAFERAKVGDSSDGQRDVRYSEDIGQGTQLGATAKNNTRPHPTANLAPCLGSKRGRCGLYLSSTVAPASSSSALSLSASSRSTPSLIAFGASSTIALASFRPSPVAARTTLITGTFWPPTSVNMTSTVEASSSPAPSPAGAPAAAGAAAATAVAETPNSSSSALIRSESSSTEMLFSSSIQSSVEILVAIYSSSLLASSVFEVSSAASSPASSATGPVSSAFASSAAGSSASGSGSAASAAGAWSGSFSASSAGGVELGSSPAACEDEESSSATGPAVEPSEELSAGASPETRPCTA